MEKPRQRKNMSVVKSTVGWIKQMFRQYDNHEAMVQIFEESFDQSDKVDPDLEPVCILCFDGGGLRGKY